MERKIWEIEQYGRMPLHKFVEAFLNGPDAQGWRVISITAIEPSRVWVVLEKD